MSITVNWNIELSVSETTLENKELGQTSPWQGNNSQLDDGGSFRRKIPAGSTDILVPMVGLSNGRLLGIKTSQTIIIKKNSSGGEPWTIRPLGVGALDGIFLVTTDGITSIYVSNAGSLDANVTFVVGGVASQT
jgi:hypothetical protein